MKTNKDAMKENAIEKGFVLDAEGRGTVCQLFVALKKMLLYHQHLGITPYPASDSLKRFLAQAPAAPALSQVKEEVSLLSQRKEIIAHNEAVVVRKKKHSEAVSCESEVFDHLAMRDIGTCSACELQHQRISSGVGRRLAPGTGPVRLLLIGDWVRGGDRGRDLFFGREEDVMVKNMITALSLPHGQVFITNVIKCSLPGAVKGGLKHARTCAAFLHQQIDALAPEYICAMGPLAAKTVLNTTTALSLLRGQLHYYNLKKGVVPVVVTYHPCFLLDNVEMKRPTWADLQFLGRQMGVLK